MRTLVVDDDATSRRLMQHILMPYGECDTAANGREATDAFRRAWEEGRPYDLICLDIMMPEMDGQRALTEIRSLESRMNINALDGVKIIMTTALSNWGDVWGAFDAQCDGYIVKPYDKGRILGEIHSLGLPVDQSP
ncbi:MAG TPA: response regulator [Syntrophorhabdales bacterium]|nr:response regulator [Syntrophorhabdales bacterium]